jgi:hypothetical protein
MTPTIAPNPHLGWCPSCMASWRPDMIAVSIPTNTGAVRVCDACIAKAHEAAQAERQRRENEDKARRQG